MAARAMRLQVTVQEGHVSVTDGAISVPADLEIRKALPSTAAGRNR
jgi:uncharacterized protein YaeQ